MTKRKTTKGFIKIFQKGGEKLFLNHLTEACEYYGLQLMSRRMMNTLKIRLEMRSSMLGKNTWGNVNRQCDGSTSTKEFKITIQRDLDLRNQLITLAHEMIHVEQIATNRLQKRVWKSDKKLHVRWEGKELGLNDGIEYSKRPWEIEARQKENALAGSWVNYYLNEGK